MSTTTEKEITTELGNATPDQVLAGTTYSSDNGIMLAGELDLGEAVTAGTVKYDNTNSTLEANYVQQAIDELDSKVENKSDEGHTHDDRYYTEQEINAKVSTLQSGINANANNITALQQNVTNQGNTLQAGITKNANDITALQESKENISITPTTETTLLNSYDGKLLINEIGAYLGEETYAGNQMFNIASVESGTLDVNNGIEIEDYLYERSNFIYAPDGTYTFSGFKYGERISELIDPISVPYTVYMYNSNKNYIDAISIVTGLNSYTLTLVDGTAFVRIVAEKGAFDNNFMMNAGSSAKAWEAFSQKPYIPQDSTTGKNLLKNNATTQTVKGITFTVNDDKSVIANGTATDLSTLVINMNTKLEDGKYILSGCPSGGSTSTYRLRGTRGFYGWDTGNGISGTYASGEALYVYIEIASGVTANNLVFKPMIRKSDIADATYEPFTNGPAPNPSYPMPIKNSKVKGIRTHWNNFLENTHEKEVTDGGVTFIVNDDGTVSINGTATKDLPYNLRSDNVPISSEMYSNCIQLSGSYSGTIQHRAFDSKYGNAVLGELGEARKLKSNIKYTIFRFTIYTGTVCNNLKLGFMVSTEEYVNTYEPYTSSEYTFSQPIDLYGMGGVQDVIMAKEIGRKFVKRVYNGDENWKVSSALSGRYYVENTGATSKSNALCSHAKFLYLSGSNVVNECYFSTQVEGRFIVNTEFATVDEWKAHLVENPMTVVLELATETTEALPIVDQIGLNSLLTYDGVTYVEFIYDELEPTLYAEYGTSRTGAVALQAYIDSLTPHEHNYAICTTVTDIAEKSVACAGFTLETGAEITVKFTYGNNAASPTLNVNNTGAKPIYYRGDPIQYFNVDSGTLTFRYNGTQYEIVGDLLIVDGNLIKGSYNAVSNNAVSLAYEEIQTELTEHTKNKENPHEVTKSQIGLDKVENKSAAEILESLTKEDIDALKVLAAAVKSFSDDGTMLCEISDGLAKFIKDSIVYGAIGVNQFTTNGQTYDALNIRGYEDFITFAFEGNSKARYYINPNNIPITDAQYTEEHFFKGSARVTGDLKVTGGAWTDEFNINKLGLNGGAAQSVEWVWDSALGRWVLCTVQE